MASVREEALSGLFTKLLTLQSSTRFVFRNKEEPVDVPQEGIILMRDGSSGEPETVFLSPQRFVYEHLSEITVVIKSSSEEDRDEALDDTMESIDALIIADRTLGGKVEWAESRAPDVFSEYDEGQLLKYAVIPIMLRFTTENALS